eukprot:TRINITY_DN68986_c0_g1_i1.p1 TRINITY_DN68986_c0_g1~~TRINITY_DN68986_c0_g1_i1.p1  ORF type:complete len:130 (-),score=19.63 TRINITY_DN68986_c0_g1_i1:89-478(-)
MSSFVLSTLPAVGVKLRRILPAISLTWLLYVAGSRLVEQVDAFERDALAEIDKAAMTHMAHVSYQLTTPPPYFGDPVLQDLRAIFTFVVGIASAHGFEVLRSRRGCWFGRSQRVQVRRRSKFEIYPYVI